MTETLTYETLRKTLEGLKDMLPPRDSGMSLFGMQVFIAPEYPKVRLNYKCRTKYGDEFEFLTKEKQAETNAWLLREFGTTSVIPERTAYLVNGMFGQGVHFNPRDAVKLCL